MERVREWLEGEEQDYAAGVALYEQLGTSQVLRRTLAYGETAFTRQKLAQALAGLLERAPALCNGHVISAPKKAPEASLKADFLCDGHVTKADPERRDWFAERNYLHPQLELVATDAERRGLALRILDVAERIRVSYDREAGRLPAASLTPAAAGPDLATLTEAGEIRRLLANLRPQRSKLKKRADRAADLARVEADIILLESKLKP